MKFRIPKCRKRRTPEYFAVEAAHRGKNDWWEVARYESLAAARLAARWPGAEMGEVVWSPGLVFRAVPFP